METANGTAQHHTVEQVAQQACQAANQADADCMALASMLEEVRAENAELRKRLARAEEFIGSVLKAEDTYREGMVP